MNRRNGLKLRTRSFLFLLFVFISVWTSAQDFFLVSGKVVDSKTRAPLAFVNIIVNNNNYIGVTTDIDGKFRIRHSRNINTLTLSYVGYQELNYHVGTKTENLIIPMVQKEVDLREVEIYPAVNPAHRIIQNAINNREYNDPEQLKSFSYTMYEKTIFTVASDTTVNKMFIDTTRVTEKEKKSELEIGIVTDTTMADSIRKDSAARVFKNFFNSQYLFLMENVTKRKFLYPDKNYNQVIATRMSGFKDPIFVFLTTQIQSFSFYKPFITIFQKTYINPISGGSLTKYFFKIEDTTFTGKDTVYIIKFRPRKGTNFDGLQGVISINTNKWAIQNVIAEPFPNSGGFRIKIQQMYELVDGEHWFPVQLNTDADLLFFQVGKYSAIASGRSYIRDIVLNPDMVRREFNHLDIEVDKDATTRNEPYWNEYRVDTLSAKDRKTYHVIDSIGKTVNLDKIAKTTQTLFSGRIPWKIFDIDINRFLDYNTYEGLILGAGIHTNDRLLKWLKVGGFYQYSFAISTAKYGGDASILLSRRNDFTIRGGYFFDLLPSGNTHFFDDSQPVISGNWGPLLYRKLDRTQNFNFSLTIRARKYWLLNLGFSQSFKKSTTNDFSSQIDNVTLFKSQYIFTEFSAGFKWAYKEVFFQTIDNKISLGTNYPIVWLQYTRGLKGVFSGEYDYNRIDLKIRKSFRIKYLGKLTFQVNGGFIDQAIPATNLYYGNASYRFITIFAPASFATMRMNEFLSDKYASLNIYHDFSYLLFKGKKWFHPEFALAQNIGFGWLDHMEKYNNGQPDVKTMDLGYYESGLLINNLVNLKIYTVGIGAFYRWGPYGFKYAGDNFAYKISIIFPF